MGTVENRRSRGSFRPRPIDINRPLPIIMHDNDLEVHDEGDIRSLPTVPVGMDAQEQQEIHLQQAIKAALTLDSKAPKDAAIPVPSVELVPGYRDLLKKWTQPQEYIVFKELSETEYLEKEVFYELDKDDLRWLGEYNAKKTPKQKIAEDDFERALDRLDKEAFNTKAENGILPRGSEKVLSIGKSHAPIVLDYYNEKREKLKRALLRHHRPPPDINDPNPALTFRSREKERQQPQRKTLRRRDDSQSYEKLRRMRHEFERARTLLELIKKRERVKKDMVLTQTDCLRAELALVPGIADIADPTRRFPREAPQPRKISLRLKFDGMVRNKSQWDEASEDADSNADSDVSDEAYLPPHETSRKRKRKRRREAAAAEGLARTTSESVYDDLMEEDDECDSIPPPSYPPIKMSHFACGRFHQPRVFSGSYPRFLRYPNHLRSNPRSRLIHPPKETAKFCKFSCRDRGDLRVRGRVGRGGRVIFDVAPRNRSGFINLEVATNGGLRYEDEEDEPTPADYDSLRYLFGGSILAEEEDLVLDNYPSYTLYRPATPPPFPQSDEVEVDELTASEGVNGSHPDGAGGATSSLAPPATSGGTVDKVTGNGHASIGEIAIKLEETHPSLPRAAGTAPQHNSTTPSSLAPHTPSSSSLPPRPPATPTHTLHPSGEGPSVIKVEPSSNGLHAPAHHLSANVKAAPDVIQVY
eukprot:Rmarinus@m.4201